MKVLKILTVRMQRRASEREKAEGILEFLETNPQAGRRLKQLCSETFNDT